MIDAQRKIRIEIWEGSRVTMRNGVVEGFNQHANGTHLRTLSVELLTGETILISTEGKTTCSAIWNRVEGELVARGVIHPQIFGLAIKTGLDWVFVDPDAKVSKYFLKDWKTTPGSSLNNENKTLVLYCRVHFYLESVPPNFDVVSLLHYYLQLRLNLTSTIRRRSSNLIQPLAYALQTELGDWTPCQGSPAWTKLLDALPGASSGEIYAKLSRAHQALRGWSTTQARTAFIRFLIPTYNMHLYGMTLRKNGKDNQAWIGVTPKGIEIYQNELGRSEIPEKPKITFLWANITKLYFERKKFEIRGRACACGGSSTEKLSFTSWNEAVPRHLLLLCRSTHQFHLSHHKILSSTGVSESRNSLAGTSTSMSASSSSAGDLNSKHEEKMLDLSLWADGLLLPAGKESTEHQRASVISNASSNTTSGIVSDRVYSLDGSEEDLELRISDCCGDQSNPTDKSTSLESLTHKHKSHHLPLKGRLFNGIPKNDGEVEVLDEKKGETEAKYWYCDSDCEEEDCGTGLPSSSILVRTINEGGEEHSCTAFCQCNSCLVDEEEFERASSSGDSESNQLIHHHNTPSLASEKTLTAVDIEIEKEPMEGSKISDDTSDKLENEHVYGELSEDPKNDMKKESQYSAIENEILQPKPKPRSVKNQLFGIQNNRDHSGHKKLKGLGANKPAVATIKEMTTGFTPKMASLKCLRTQRAMPWTKGVKENKGLSIGSPDEADGCYIEFDKQLTQGRYPSTRTVSDNFDTDADYVQLPPLHPRRPPPKRPTTCKLWKFVNLKGSSHHKSSGNVDEVDSPRGTIFLPPAAVTTLPRRVSTNPLPLDMAQLQLNFEKMGTAKSISKSTTAINSIAIDERPPEPPPKPKKLAPSSEVRIATKAVDARFITSKPQILIQTAYASPATVAIPGQAQILCRGPQKRAPISGRSHSQSFQQSSLSHSLSMDNIYDTVAAEESTQIRPNFRKQVPLPPLPPPLLPKPSSASSSSVIIRPNNYIDVHASSPARNKSSNERSNGSRTESKNSVQPPNTPRKHPPPATAPITGKSRCGSVPNNLHTFYVGLQNLKPLSRAPIVYPATTCSSTLQNAPDLPNPVHCNVNPSHDTLPYSNPNPATGSLTTLYTSHFSRSQIQQFKAQLYSDMDYVIFPPKDPRMSQQEYSDSKNLSLTTMTSTNSNPMLSSTFSLNDIPPPYLPPPPPYPFDPESQEQGTTSRKPARPLPSTTVSNVFSTASLPQQDSYSSLYTASNTSQCSSSQYGGYYAMGTPSMLGSSSTVGLNAENLQKFLSTQSLTGSHYLSSPPPQIYYPASTHSAPPLPPYKNSSQVLIENGMRKAVQRLMAKTSWNPNDDSSRMKLLSRSEESLYSQPLQETEEKLAAIYNLPPPPPYKKKPVQPTSEVDLTSIRQKCTALELPLLKALLNSSDGAITSNQQPQGQLRRPIIAVTNSNSRIQAEVLQESVPVPPARPPKPPKLRQQQQQ